MTRINLVDPKILADNHLMAEWREIKMVPAALRRSLRTKTVQDVKRNIPKEYTLNTGHVRFFYDKMSFLKNRYRILTDELLSRGYNLIESSGNFDQYLHDIPTLFCTAVWTPNQQDIFVNVERILLRISEKPSIYRYRSKYVGYNFFNELYVCGSECIK